MTAEQFIITAYALKSASEFEELDNTAHIQQEPPISRRARKAYENGPGEGNLWEFFKSDLGRYLERSPVVSEEVALNYATLIRDTMLNPRPSETEWHDEYRPHKLCTRLVAKELKRREDGSGPKEKKKTREECILDTAAEIRETFVLARDAIDRVYYYDENRGRYEFAASALHDPQRAAIDGAVGLQHSLSLVRGASIWTRRCGT